MRTVTSANHRLRDLMAQLELTGQRLADEVNLTGRESGLVLRYDRTAVAHWLRGVTPRPPVPELVAEVFSRRLGRNVDAAETGLCDTKGPARSVAAPSWWAGDLQTVFARLAPAAAEARTPGTYNLSSLAQPAWSELAGLDPHPRCEPDRQDRTGRAEIAAATAMTTLFSETDTAFGGARALGATTSYLATAIGPWIARAANARTRDALLTIASRLSYLAGFMCFDATQHARAQRYYLLSLRLARESQNAHAYALGLRALSVQARELGHHRDAFDLAHAALDSTPADAPAKTRAFVLGNLAVTRAAIGERSSARADLALAEGYLDQARQDADAVGVFNSAALAHCRAALCLADKDNGGAVAALTASLRDRPTGERRSRAITRARLAELHWGRGRVEAACTDWGLFLDDYAHLGSARADQALANLKALTRPRQRRPAVAALRRRAAFPRAG